jgi:hypothetical protein
MSRSGGRSAHQKAAPLRRSRRKRATLRHPADVVVGRSLSPACSRRSAWRCTRGSATARRHVVSARRGRGDGDGDGDAAAGGARPARVAGGRCSVDRRAGRDSRRSRRVPLRRRGLRQLEPRPRAGRGGRDSQAAGCAGRRRVLPGLDKLCDVPARHQVVEAEPDAAGGAAALPGRIDAVVAENQPMSRERRAQQRRRVRSGASSMPRAAASRPAPKTGNNNLL